MKSEKDEKYTYFDFIVYPENHVDDEVDWIKRLKLSHGMFVISPLHQPDEDEKKPHFHVIYKHGNPITLQTAWRVLSDVKDIAANGYIEPTRRPHGYMRYLLHLDDPDKEQFEGGRELCTIINSFPLDLSRDLSKSELIEIRRNIFIFIERMDIDEYSKLLDELFLDDEMLDYACNHTILFKNYLDSKRHAKERNIDEY